MTPLAAHHTFPTAELQARAGATTRDIGIDTMRGVAILMVIGIHSLQQPLNAWQTAIDAALRPCVPIFLFVSGYLTAVLGKVPLGKRLQAALVPYAIAFAAAYIYMALHNPAMDHRATTTLARFGLAYLFVYYYVFVYVGCTVALWLIFTITSRGPRSDSRRVALLLLAVVFGFVAGSYLDPLLLRSGLAESLVEEVRMRDIPFWFTFMALGTLLGEFQVRQALANQRTLLLGATTAAYIVYAAVRLFSVGDAADYDSIAFFGYAALACCLFLALDARFPFIASLGSGSYFIYLWHIFFVMLLRDHARLRALGPAAASAITYVAAATASIAALILVREFVPARLHRWLGA
ncbi:acyltransferase [Bradyrhizobium sp. Tv2a-2]|uniref:acyltransferase family protein n=1 Tax=Bradyrhizobium sp. Tv2a-2 TaxID=113395 RepID=UPI00040D5D05|nr:acyltransferase [Bradyrhizobium sp. Tv2a-2]